MLKDRVAVKNILVDPFLKGGILKGNLNFRVFEKTPVEKVDVGYPLNPTRTQKNSSGGIDPVFRKGINEKVVFRSLVRNFVCLDRNRLRTSD